MNDAKAPLAFGLKESDLSKVELSYRFYSAKSGAGSQEITIHGSGKVTLLFSRNSQDAPQLREGRLDPGQVAQLLDFMAEQGLLDMPDLMLEHKAPPQSRRVLRLVLPDQTKTVALDEPGFPAFERMVGAIRYAAALAVPETLHHRFFPNL